MVQVRVLGIALDATGKHVVLLKPLGEAEGEGRVVPIWIGGQEATSTLIALSDEPAPRPMSHDLMATILGTVGASVARVEVTRIEDGTFYAEITLDTATGRTILDARPSDSIALAVRVGAPIHVADEVVDDAGVPAAMVEPAAEESAGESGGSEAGGADAPAPAGTAEEQVDEFKRFLDDVEPEDFEG
ncbi:bifunctional nuclease family protein [Agromyces sp. MMS24-JH15]|uniref:bifunctional nuclease family protein n=1 Tax=Agromyces sp. MMS24-JH15 TaxID=3243765 RepID=UPI00374A107E